MLDRQSNWNLVENNIASGNVNGIALYDSHNNLIRRNDFSQNQFGIRANQMSSRNNFFENRLHENKKGIFLYAKSEKNVIMDNDIVANDQGISLRESSGNVIVNSLHNGRNILSLKLDEFSKISNFIEPIQ